MADQPRHLAARTKSTGRDPVSPTGAYVPRDPDTIKPRFAGRPLSDDLRWLARPGYEHDRGDAGDVARIRCLYAVIGGTPNWFATGERHRDADAWPINSRRRAVRFLRFVERRMLDCFSEHLYFTPYLT